MDSGLIANRVEKSLVKARLVDEERRKRRRKDRRRFLPPVEPKSYVQFRPSLDQRMPTLGNNKIFCLHLEESKVGALRQEHLSYLERYPPRHLHDIRATLSKELGRVGKSLIRLERKYYGIKKTLSPQLTKYVPVFKGIMSATDVSAVKCLPDLEEILKRVASQREKFKDDLVNVALIKEIGNRIKDFIPECFTHVVEHCWKIFKLIGKYCISFYDVRDEVHVDTIEHYHEQIVSWKDVIIKNLENLLRVSRQIRKEGVSLQSFSTNVKQVGLQYHCSTVPLLLTFSECCANIRNASFAMASWIKADENYCSFLRNDIFDYECKRDEAVVQMREVQERFHSVTYKLNQLETELNKLYNEVTQLKEKEDMLMDDEQFLASQENEMEVEIGVKETRCKQLRRYHDRVSDEMVEEMSLELRAMKERLPFVNRQLSNVRYKLGWIKSRREIMVRCEEEIKKTQDVLETLGNEKLSKESEYRINNAKLELTRRIHMFKTTPGAVEKLFYGLALRTKPTANQQATDPLDTACEVVSSLLEQDWAKLYRNLPFVPQRGQVTLEKDIQEIGRDANRLALVEHSNQALKRWRRFHTRATVKDLMESLKMIKRSDLVQEVQLKLNPPPEVTDDEDNDKDLPVGPELVPYYRQVERYDKIRAAKKAQMVK